MRNATTLAGVPGLGFQGRSQTGWSSLTLTNGNGNFAMDATAEAWQVQGDQNYGCW
jgi:hypothetical protein